LESFDVGPKDDLQLEGINIWLLFASPLEVDEHIAVLGYVCLDLRLHNVQGMKVKLSPGVELVCQMILYRVGHTSMFSVIFKASFTQVYLFFKTVKSSNFVVFVGVLVLVNALFLDEGVLIDIHIHC